MAALTSVKLRDASEDLVLRHTLAVREGRAFLKKLKKDYLKLEALKIYRRPYDFTRKSMVANVILAFLAAFPRRQEELCAQGRRWKA